MGGSVGRRLISLTAASLLHSFRPEASGVERRRERVKHERETDRSSRDERGRVTGRAVDRGQRSEGAEME